MFYLKIFRVGKRKQKNPSLLKRKGFEERLSSPCGEESQIKRYYPLTSVNTDDLLALACAIIAVAAC